MLQGMEALSLSGSTDTLESVAFLQTVSVPDRTVTATIALSACSMGVDLNQRQVGAVAALIRRYGRLKADKSVQVVETPDAHHNTAHISRCVFVTFDLVVSFAWADAIASLYLEAVDLTLPYKPFPRTNLEAVLVYDRADHHVVLVHRFLALADASFPLDGDIEAQAIQDAAAANGRPREALAIHRVAEADLKPGVGYAVDPETLRPQPLPRTHGNVGV